MLLSAAVAVGCARIDSTVDAEREQQWQSHQQSLASFDSWDLHARAAVRIDNAAYNIGIRWQRECSIALVQGDFGHHQVVAIVGQDVLLRGKQIYLSLLLAELRTGGTREIATADRKQQQQGQKCGDKNSG